MHLSGCRAAIHCGSTPSPHAEPPSLHNPPAYLRAFSYVNGGLFRNPTEGRPHHAPIFSRQVLIESGEFDWSATNPDIFGSMIQAVMTYKCYNMNPQRLEQLLHTFFGKACLNVDVFDKNSNRYTPKEWFIAPLNVVEQAIEIDNFG